MTELRQEGSMRAGGKKGFSKCRRRGSGTQVEPNQRDSLAPRPKVLSTRLAEAAEWARPKRTAEGGQMARERAMLLASRGLQRKKGRVYLAGVEESPFGRGGSPGP